MKITKLGHCCLLIEENGLRILTDPGMFSSAQDKIKDINVILITHEHADHFHIDSVKNIIANAGPKGLVIITNKSVGLLLEKEGIPHYQIVEHGQKIDIKGVSIEGHGEKHAEIYKTIPGVENTGYFIAGRLFYPGDAFHNPGRPIDILALPVAGPWMKLSEAIDYAQEVKPKVAFPVHDGMLKPEIGSRFNQLFAKILQSQKIEFLVLEESKETEF